MSRRKTFYNLSNITEDQIIELMESVSSAEDTEDESIADPDFNCADDELVFA